MAAPFPSSSRMDAWPQRRGLQTMNLRSVFTAEQQRILERYYDNGMTNQSKACFQLILQCAQEAKLDFSVVRTWVGNKRRKLASKVDQNGSLCHSLSGHGLAGGLLSNHTLAGGALSNHSLAAAGALLPAEMAAARSLQSRVHLLPPSTSFPSFSSASSSPSSSSPLSSSSINNSNNDVILTGIYSLNSVPRSRPRPAAAPPPASQSDPELSAHASSSLINQVLQSRSGSASSPVHSKLASLAQTLPSLASSASGPLVYTAVRKGAVSGMGAGAGVVPHGWARQYLWSSSSSKTQAQLQPRPHSNPQPQPPTPQKPRVPPAVRSPGPSSEQTPRIQQVFTLSDRAEGDRLRPAPEPEPEPEPARRERETRGRAALRLDGGHVFSIAMETGDEEDEWQREEELAELAARTHLHREQASGPRGGHSPPGTGAGTGSRLTLLHADATLQGSYSLTAQTSHTGEASAQTSVGVSAAPWVISNSRKRTLQDRTQFSDGDLLQLKRYWDRGMTSLGSVCREKISAAANQLSVDTEIVKTWISNRRRKYRLMGIEIPPPKGGPAVFAASSPGEESPVGLSPGEGQLGSPELADDLNDGGSVCLSEDGTIDSQHRDGDDGTELLAAAPLANNVKIEVIDEDEEGDDEEGDDDGDFVASDLEQMQNLLEFKHEEVQFLESELENQKQKYLELANFTKSLLIALRNNDLERQQELMASLPQPSDQDWDVAVERGVQHADQSADDPSVHDFPESAGGSVSGAETPPPPLPPALEDDDEVPMVPVNIDNTINEVTKTSASEEQLQEAE